SMMKVPTLTDSTPNCSAVSARIFGSLKFSRSTSARSAGVLLSGYRSGSTGNFRTTVTRMNSCGMSPFRLVESVDVDHGEVVGQPELHPPGDQGLRQAAEPAPERRDGDRDQARRVQVLLQGGQPQVHVLDPGVVPPVLLGRDTQNPAPVREDRVVHPAGPHLALPAEGHVLLHLGGPPVPELPGQTGARDADA